MTWRGVWEGEAGLSRLRLVPEGFNGPEEPIDVLAYVVEALRGQCQESLLNVLERIELETLEDDKNFTSALDEEVFECTACNWWCETSEMNDDDDGQPVCDDCAD